MRPAARWSGAIAVAAAAHAAVLGLVRVPAPEAPRGLPAPDDTGPRLTFWTAPLDFRDADIRIPPTPAGGDRVEIRRQRRIHPPAPPRHPGPRPGGQARQPFAPDLMLEQPRWGAAAPLPPLLEALARASLEPRVRVAEADGGLELGLPRRADDLTAWLAAAPPRVIADLSESPPAASGWTWARISADDEVVRLPNDVRAWLAEAGVTLYEGTSVGGRVVYLPRGVRAAWEARRPEALDLWRNLVVALGGEETADDRGGEPDSGGRGT